MRAIILNMSPFDPIDNNLKISRACIQASDDAFHFKYNELKETPQECNQSATELRNQWAGMGDLCGRMVILSAEVEEYQFAEIKEGLERFLDWFKALTQSLSKEFLETRVDFDFVEASAQGNNAFLEWLNKELPSPAISALRQVLESFKSLNFYANDRELFAENPVKPLIDKALNTSIAKDLSLRTVLEAIGLSFIEGD